jgi:hypothetical protein
MIVEKIYQVEGGTIVVVDNLPSEVRLGDIITNGEHEWFVVGAEGVSPEHETGLALKEVSANNIYPTAGEKLTLKPRPILDQELGRITVRNFIEIQERLSKERQDLATILKDLDKAIMHLELELIDSTPSSRMEAFKLLRETFNAIPPKWFHR